MKTSKMRTGHPSLDRHEQINYVAMAPGMTSDSSHRGSILFLDESYTWIGKWLSIERFQPYLDSSEGNAHKALELYLWNAALSQVVMQGISHFEIALRNAVNSAMESCWHGQKHWPLDDASPARQPIMRKAARGMLDSNRINRIAIDAVVSTLPSSSTIGDIVSNLTLGFWVHLSDRSREAVIWRTGLYRAWPKGTNRAELQKRLMGILRVRNRSAHGERLFNPTQEQLSPRRANDDAAQLLWQLCPQAAEHLYGAEGQTPIDAFLKDHPAPANIRL